MMLRVSVLVLVVVVSCSVVYGGKLNDAAGANAVVLEAVAVVGSAPYFIKHGTRSKRAIDEYEDKTKSRLTQDDRISLIKAHNEARSTVTPKAENMMWMHWNASLEYTAQKWAETCAFDHGQIASKEAIMGKGPIGQNLWVGTGGYDPSGATASWDKERNYYTYANMKCETGKMCGHYTQVVWHNSDEVGCGIQYCDSMKSFQAGWIMVCNYRLAGNWRGQQPYTSGDSCSNCPDGFSNCENNICRKDPKCGDLKCAYGGKMDELTCLCDCGPDPYNKMGPYCRDHPMGGASGINPSSLVLFITVTLTFLAKLGF